MTEKKNVEQVTVSVVIPFFSNVAWLGDAVNSVLAQTFTDYEIIVVNDGSSEDMSEFLQQYGDKIVYRKKRNGGPGSARNVGIDTSLGKYIAFLDSDDLWPRDKLKSQVMKMEETGAVWSHTNWQMFRNNDVNQVVRRFVSDCHGYIFPRSLISTVIATPCVMVRADVLKKQKNLRFNEEMRYGQDYFLWLLLSAEYPIELIDRSLCFVRYRGSNAIVRARVHLQLRRNIWNQFKQKKESYFYKKGSYLPIRIVYRICVLEDRFIEKIEKMFSLSYKASEWIVKFLYFGPYTLFLFLKLFYRIDKKCR